MALVNGKWKVVKGDCLWNIAKTVYKNAYRWTEIAKANGISQSRPIIYPGQLLTIPGITSGSGSAPKPATGKTVVYQWFALDAGTDRSMFATWIYNRDNTDHYEVHWEYDTGQGGWRKGDYNDNVAEQQSSYSAPSNAKKVRIRVRPISKTHKVKNNDVHYWTDGEWLHKEYDFSNNPPSLPPNPSIDIDLNNTLTVTINNIDEDINADSIEIAIYQNDTTKYNSAKVPINTDARFAKYTCIVPDGYEYKVRCRAVRGSIYGGWTDFTSNIQALPTAPATITTLTPRVISEQMSKKYGVFVEWEEVKTAKKYEVQWTTNTEYFDSSGQVSSQTTEEGKGPRILIADIEPGHEYFFRVRSVNDKGSSKNWSAIKSIKIGSKPSAPTTWSNTSSCVIGEDLNLYWVHNATDNSIETYARLNIKVIDSMHPTAEPMEYTKVIKNDKPEEEKNQTSVYIINTNDDEWALVKDGFIIKWKVQTAGIDSEYSDWSIEREINVYAKPELSLDVTDQNGESISEINTFPFHISVAAGPSTQVPISYYLEVVANEGYETVDDVGNTKTINAGDKVYQKYYDPDTNAWRFIAVMTPANIDLKDHINYTVNCTVSMNSGLTAKATQSFDVYFNDLFYDVFADVVINKETLEANIHPYCNEYDEGYISTLIIDSDGSKFIDVDGAKLAYESVLGSVPKLVENCKLSVYRREYDGSFTEIATNINNEEGLYVTDPHPSLDYARYRVVAKTNDTGAVSYADIPSVKFGEPSVVIQWSEAWSSFEMSDEDEGTIEPTWSGSMVKIPYNIDISENNDIDVSLIEYVGRKHPVTYYGTQLGESSTWNVEIPKDDKETLYAIRRLSKWTGDVYVREPSGIGYWANISVSYNIKHKDLTIPITFNIKRVEGGM